MSVLATVMLGASLLFAPPADAQPRDGVAWAGTWGVAPAGPPSPANAPVFTNQTVRLIVHVSAGGKRVRIRLSNEMGTTPLRIGSAHIGIRAGAANVAPGSDRVLTFSGKSGVTIAPGAPALSDPVALNVVALTDLAISLYVPGTASEITLHGVGKQTHYISQPGDFTGAATLPVASTLTSTPFLTAVDVEATGSAAIVALGDSITDGNNSTAGDNNRWPDWLARRLQAATGESSMRLGVVNRGISGNRLLGDTPPAWLSGRGILERFDRDVLATSGVRYLVLMVGINDIGNSTPAERVTADDLIAGYRQVIARAQARGIAVIGATLIPFEGAGYYSAEKEAVRQAVNAWIRSSGAFDAVIDFDRVMRDPASEGRILAAYDSGDHLHPNDMGYQAMGNAVPLGLFNVGR